MDKRTYKGRGPEVPDEVEVLIGQVYRRRLKVDPGVTAKEVMAEVHHLLQRDGKQLRHGWPGISKVQKVIGEIKSRVREYPTSPLDEPWSLGSMAEYPLPSEALPTVMASYRKCLAENDVLPIREALWIGRLYGAIEPKDLVSDWAFLYAMDEMVSEDLGRPFDSTRLDLELIKDAYYAHETQREIAIWGIAEKYGADPVKLKDLNLSIEETEGIVKSNPEKFVEKEEILIPSSYSKEAAKLADNLTEAQLIDLCEKPAKPAKNRQGGTS
jgi:hypothetical protein